MDEPNETTEQTPEETPAEPEAVETTESTDSPPWGEDFDAQRAWNTIQTLRGEVKEAKQGAQEVDVETLLRDPQRYAEVLDALGLEEVDEDPDQYDEDEEFVDPYEQRLSGVEEQMARQQEMDDLRAFSSHLQTLAQGAEVELTERDRQVLLNASQEYGFNPEATEKAFKEYLEERKTFEKRVIEDYIKSKKNAPHVSTVGTNANEVPDLDDDQTRQKWMAERWAQAQQ